MELREAFKAARANGYPAARALDMAHARVWREMRARADYDNAAWNLARYKATPGADVRRYAEPFATLTAELERAQLAVASARQSCIAPAGGFACWQGRPASYGDDTAERRAELALTAHMDSRREDGGLVYLPAGVLRNVTKAENVSDHIKRQGDWISSEDGSYCKDGSGLMWGVVGQLVGRDGKARYVGGYVVGEDSEDGATWDMTRICEGEPESCLEYSDAAREAARIGNDMAERAAKAEREYQEAWRAGTQFAEMGDQIAEVRREALAIAAERRAARGRAALGEFPSLCAALGERISGAWERIGELRRERAEFALPHWASKSQRDAWHDGAGLVESMGGAGAV